MLTPQSALGLWDSPRLISAYTKDEIKVEEATVSEIHAISIALSLVQTGYRLLNTFISQSDVSVPIRWFPLHLEITSCSQTVCM